MGYNKTRCPIQYTQVELKKDTSTVVGFVEPHLAAKNETLVLNEEDWTVSDVYDTLDAYGCDNDGKPDKNVILIAWKLKVRKKQ